MDTSNPVLPADRRSIDDILDSQKRRRRQDLGYLRDVALTSTKILLPLEDPELLPEGEVKDICCRFLVETVKVPVDKTKEIPTVFEVLHESLPVCGLLTSIGVPVHPPAVNNSAGKVSVQRVMGGVPGNPWGLREMVEVIGARALERTHVYTSGTWKGFVARIDKQMGRKTVALTSSYSQATGVKIGEKFLMRELDRLFPRSPVKGWPSLEEDLHEHLKKIKVTAASSAGAPYWRNKGECMQEIMEDVLPLVVQALKEDNLQHLYKTNPELFLCEVKNKLDRYEIGKLEEKTRPYCCIPAHWAFLFSTVAQRFQEGLHLFDTDSSSCNAYGFTAPKGGLNRMYDWFMTAPVGGKFAVYGDDTCLVFSRPDGVYRVDPDFQQMDGSLNQADVQLAVRWMAQTVARESGEDMPAFWLAVCKQWIEMACNPMFVLDGQAVYKKKQPHGMMSGVPGTTMFDTVKSALAWNLYLQQSQVLGRDPLDGEWAAQFMLNMGLVIKPGTWEPARIPELVVGNLITDHKFLGVQMLVVDYKGGPLIVPTIPESEAINMLVVQKDNPFDRKISEMTRKRRLFDRMRGLYLTIGFSSSLIRDAICHVVNTLDPAAILMCTNLGSGEKPDHILLEDFAYPDSSGFPTLEFCKSLYSSDELRPGWVQIFPDLVPILENLRAERREVELTLNDRNKPVVREISTQTEPDIEFGVLASKHDSISAAKISDPPYERSEIKQRDGTKRKTVPTLGESIRLYLADLAVKMDKVGMVSRRFACPNWKIVEACKQYGIFCSGDTDESLLSLEPLHLPLVTMQDKVIESNRVQSRVISKKQKYQKQMLHALDRDEQCAAPLVDLRPNFFLDEEFFSRMVGIYELGRDCVASLQHFIQGQQFVESYRWRTIGVMSGCENPVWIALECKERLRDWARVCEVHSLNRRLAQEYVCKYVHEVFGVGLWGSLDSQCTRLDVPLDEVDWAEEMELTKANVVVQPIETVLRQVGTREDALIETLGEFLGSQGVTAEQGSETFARLLSTLDHNDELRDLFQAVSHDPYQLLVMIADYLFVDADVAPNLQAPKKPIDYERAEQVLARWKDSDFSLGLVTRSNPLDDEIPPSDSVVESPYVPSAQRVSPGVDVFWDPDTVYQSVEEAFQNPIQVASGPQGDVPWAAVEWDRDSDIPTPYAVVDSRDPETMFPTALGRAARLLREQLPLNSVHGTFVKADKDYRLFGLTPRGLYRTPGNRVVISRSKKKRRAPQPPIQKAEEAVVLPPPLTAVPKRMRRRSPILAPPDQFSDHTSKPARVQKKHKIPISAESKIHASTHTYKGNKKNCRQCYDSNPDNVVKHRECHFRGKPSRCRECRV